MNLLLDNFLEKYNVPGIKEGKIIQRLTTKGPIEGGNFDSWLTQEDVNGTGTFTSYNMDNPDPARFEVKTGGVDTDRSRLKANDMKLSDKSRIILFFYNYKTISTSYVAQRIGLKGPNGKLALWYMDDGGATWDQVTQFYIGGITSADNSNLVLTTPLFSNPINIIFDFHMDDDYLDLHIENYTFTQKNLSNYLDGTESYYPQLLDVQAFEAAVKTAELQKFEMIVIS